MIQSFKWTYGRLICEFDHWDICLSGLVEHDDKKWLCEPIDSTKKQPDYKLYPVEWSDECEDFLEDYRVVYSHWCYINGRRSSNYNGNSEWFEEKWGDRNPIIEKRKKNEN